MCDECVSSCAFHDSEYVTEATERDVGLVPLRINENEKIRTMCDFVGGKMGEKIITNSPKPDLDFLDSLCKL